MTVGHEPGRLYRRLEVGPGASREEIVRAYRRLAHGAHPDVHPEDPEASRRFREITEAYEVLSDPARRANYDRTNDVPPLGVGGLRVAVRTSPDPPPPARPAPIHLHRPPVAGLPLWAGPVSVEPAAAPRKGMIGRLPTEAEFARMLSELLDLGWHRWRP